MDLIFPETVLTTTVNEAEEVTEVEIQTPQADSSEEVTTATADLTTNQVTVDDQTVSKLQIFLNQLQKHQKK